MSSAFVHRTSLAFFRFGRRLQRCRRSLREEEETVGPRRKRNEAVGLVEPPATLVLRIHDDGVCSDGFHCCQHALHGIGDEQVADAGASRPLMAREPSNESRWNRLVPRQLVRANSRRSWRRVSRSSRIGTRAQLISNVWRLSAATKRRAGGRGFATAFKKASRSSPRSIIGAVLFNDASSCIVCEVACGEAGQRCCPLDELANGWRDAEFHPVPYCARVRGAGSPCEPSKQVYGILPYISTSWRGMLMLAYLPAAATGTAIHADRPVLLDQLAANPKRATQATGSLHAHAT